jgi:hypothetical protein
VVFVAWVSLKVYLFLAPQCVKEWEIRGDAYTLFIPTA